ncbi:MAG: hypothetical protein R2860_05625 [Desulfobacterales bacterium]
MKTWPEQATMAFFCMFMDYGKVVGQLKKPIILEIRRWPLFSMPDTGTKGTR